MSLPSIFSYYAEKLSGASKQYFRILPHTGSATVTAGQSTRFALPTSSIINTRSVRIFFNVKTTGTDGARLPASLDALISRVTLYAGGVAISSQHNNYGLLCQAKTIFEEDRQSVCHGHLDIVREHPYQVIPKDVTTLTGATAQAVANSLVLTQNKPEDDSANVPSGDTLYCLELKHTFLSTVEPSCINAQLFPEMVVEIVWESNNVLPAVKDVTLPDPCRIGTHQGQKRVVVATGNSTQAATSDITLPHATITSKYEVSDLHMSLEVLSMASSVLQEIEARRISEQGFLSLIYKGWSDHPFSAGNVSAAQMSLSSQSLDRLYCCFHRADRLERGGVVPVVGHKMKGAFTSKASVTESTATLDQDVGLPSNQDTGSTSHTLTNSERYLSRAQNLEFVPASDSVGPTFQIRANSALIPATPASVDEAYYISANSVDTYKSTICMRSQYILNYACFVLSFCLPGSSFRREASGVDTRGLSSSFSVLTTGLSTSDQSMTVFAEASMFLRVGAGGQLQVLQ